MIGRHIVELDREKWLRIVAQQERAAFSHAPPFTLLSGRYLKVVELERNCALDDVKTVNRASASGKWRSCICYGNCLLHRRRIGRDGERVLIFALQRKRQRPSDCVRSEEHTSELQ